MDERLHAVMDVALKQTEVLVPNSVIVLIVIPTSQDVPEEGLERAFVKTNLDGEEAVDGLLRAMLKGKGG